MSKPSKYLISEYSFLFDGKLTPTSVGWGSNSANILRRYTNFCLLAASLSFDPEAIIDFGSGYGEFINFLPRIPFFSNSTAYIGVEPNNLMLTAGRNKFDSSLYGLNPKYFYCHEISTFLDPLVFPSSFSRSYFCLANGLFTQKFKVFVLDFEIYVLECVEKILSYFANLELAFAFNTMLPSPAYRLDNLFYPSSDILTKLESLASLYDFELTLNYDLLLCETYFLLIRQ